MTVTPPITLHYFDCRGRAQHFRYYFRQRGIAFIDKRVSLKEGFGAWMAIKADQAQTGPFQKLPVLHWGSRLIAEGPVIQQWLHRHCGDEALLDDDGNLQHAMLSSSLASEVMLPLALLLYQELMYPNSDLLGSARETLKRLQGHLQLLEQALREWQWLAGLGRRPMMLADCQLWETLNSLETVLGSALSLSDYPQLSAFYRDCPGAALFRRMLVEHPGQLTGSPQEVDVIGRIQQGLAG